MLHMEHSLVEGVEEGASSTEALQAGAQQGVTGGIMARGASSGDAEEAELEQEQTAAFMAAVLSDLQVSCDPRPGWTQFCMLFNHGAF
jgi:hypothetical protein